MAKAQNLAVQFVQTNPKRAGTESHARYERYKSAKTFREVVPLGEDKTLLEKNSIDNEMDAWSYNLTCAAARCLFFPQPTLAQAASTQTLRTTTRMATSSFPGEGRILQFSALC